MASSDIELNREVLLKFTYKRIDTAQTIAAGSHNHGNYAGIEALEI
jgi:hypothetical protein